VPVSLDINFLFGARSSAAIDQKDFTLVVGRISARSPRGAI
jgi:hypothetical protein